MPDLKDMKRTPAELKEETAEMDAPTPDDYPYGLRLHLDDETLEKLDASLKAGEDVMIVARAKVKNINTHEEETEEGGGIRSNAELQITHMTVAEATKSFSEKANSMFPDTDKD